MTATIHYLDLRQPESPHRINWPRVGWLLFAVAWSSIFWVGLFTLLRAVLS